MFNDWKTLNYAGYPWIARPWGLYRFKRSGTVSNSNDAFVQTAVLQQQKEENGENIIN